MRPMLPACSTLAMVTIMAELAEGPADHTLNSGAVGCWLRAGFELLCRNWDQALHMGVRAGGAALLCAPSSTIVAPSPRTPQPRPASTALMGACCSPTHITLAN